MRTIVWCVQLSVLALCGCNSAQSPATPPPEATPFRIVSDVKQMMNWIIEPNAAVVWNSVATIISTEGRQEIMPRTDEEWTAVRNSAAIVAESGNLLMLEGRARNKTDWMAKSRAMIDAAYRAMNAAEVKDPEALFAAGGDIYQSCSDCHAQYALSAMQRVDSLPADADK